jgi:hypothetical protein
VVYLIMDKSLSLPQIIIFLIFASIIYIMSKSKAKR